MFNAPAGFEEYAPYTMALVKLAEGPMVTAQLTDVDSGSGEDRHAGGDGHAQADARTGTRARSCTGTSSARCCNRPRAVPRPACARSISVGRPKSPSPAEISNAALAHLPNNVPTLEAEFQHLAASFKPLVDPKLAFFAEVNGEPVAFALTLPDLNAALQHVNGRLWPFAR